MTPPPSSSPNTSASAASSPSNAPTPSYLTLPEPIASAQDFFPSLPQSILADPRPTPTHCGLSVASLYARLLPALAPLLVAAAILLGWRALAAFGIVVASTFTAVLLWRFVGQRGKGLLLWHTLYLSALLALLMPAQLARDFIPSTASPDAGWPLLVAAGFLLAFLYWLLGGVGARFHPVATTILILLLIFPAAMTPTTVLIRGSLFKGDILNAVPAASIISEPAQDPLLSVVPPPASATANSPRPDAVRLTPATSRLTDFTHGSPSQDGTWTSLDTLIRDHLPPLEDLVVGGHPSPIGLSSLIAVLAGGLILLHRGGADWRIPFFTLATAFACFISLRLPLVVTPAGPVWRWLPFLEPGISWATLITFASYQITAGPLVFTAFFLATSGASSPTSRRGRIVYAGLLGVMSATAQLYISVPAGPLLALLMASFISPWLDRVLRPKPLL